MTSVAYGIAMPASRGILVRQSYCAQAESFFARLATQPSQARKALYDTLIRALVSAGAWANVDVLQVIGADQATSLANLVQASFGATAVNSPAFVADRYFAGDGSSSYLNSNFNPATAGGRFRLNSSAIGFWSVTAGLSSGTQMGSNDASTRTRLQANSAASFALMSTSGLPTWTNTASDGFFLATRTSTGNVNVYRNSVSLGSLTEGADSLTSQPIYVGGLNNSGTFGVGSTAQIAAVIIGGNLDPYQAAIYSALYNYLHAIGAV